ncbi:hypothetical protein [Streptococcus suis]|uniref:hypothetical protein n=1 Tax=Streptococcus suis TaxID=1307 RepID=UPI001CF3EA6F|nr:hypothetical protein [Streptococcus suis]MCB2884233.1 hypothetical protein [Streptococcus suis]MCB2890308.1 hypothetical protein [Streptococcus suis]MCB2911041.1 hypothetical protein [Streptococcus suis]MCB2913149.1 hypothetical protein [Streptococcus suis]MCQ8255965.1 hypothetical protein [Streptococcus suis]
MKLVEFLESHDKAIAAKFNILDLIRNGNERIGHVLISNHELEQELDRIFRHIEFLEKTITTERKYNGES